MKDARVKFMRKICHDLTNVKTTFQAGLAHIENPDSAELSRGLCEQALTRLDQILRELEDRIDIQGENGAAEL